MIENVSVNMNRFDGWPKEEKKDFKESEDVGSKVIKTGRVYEVFNTSYEILDTESL